MFGECPPARSKWIALRRGCPRRRRRRLADPGQHADSHRAALAVEHFLVYFIATSIFCVAWLQPFIVAGVMMAFSVLLEALQGLTPDRTPDLPTALAAAAGALTAGVLAKLVIKLRRLALARAKQI